MKKILMVCLGNICRSPLAEGILKHKLAAANIAAQVDSAGTSGFHNGDLPDKRSIAVAAAHDIDLTDQRSRLFLAQDLKDFDIVYAMDSMNLKDILALATSAAERKKVKLIMEEAKPGLAINVPDPYFGHGDSGFYKVFDMLSEASDSIVAQLKADTK